MKISEMIRRLQNIEQVVGDIECVLHRPADNTPIGVIRTFVIPVDEIKLGEFPEVDGKAALIQ